MNTEKRNEEIDAEIDFHLHETIERLVADGMSEADARAEAARRFGSRLMHTDRIARAGAVARTMRPSIGQRLSILRDEVRLAARGLRRAPAFTATAVVTLGLVIGANITMFGIADSFMFRPLAYLRDPGSVTRAYWQWDDHGKTVVASSTQFPRYTDILNGTRSFSQVAVFAQQTLPVGSGDLVEDRQVAAVSASYFSLFDAAPMRGRFFTASEDVIPRGVEVAVLGHEFWRTRFGGADVIGQQIRIGDMRPTIVGVAPAGFDGLFDGRPPVAFVPVTAYASSTGTTDSQTYASAYKWGWVQVLARLGPGVTPAVADSDATNVFRATWATSRADNPSMPALEAANPRVNMGPLRSGAGPTPGLEARTSLWLVGVAVAVLLIGCANVANLSVTRALERRRESTVKVALGVSAGRLALSAFVESTMVAVTGGALALIVSRLLRNALAPMLKTLQVPNTPIFSDGRTLLGTTIIVGLVALLTGLMPMLITRRSRIASSLREGARGGTADGRRVRAGLLAVQAMLSVILLVGAALFVRSLVAVKFSALGYDPERVLVVNRSIPPGGFDPEQQRVLRNELLRVAASLPDVQSVAWMSSAPFVSTSSTDLFVDGVPDTKALGPFTFQATTAGYFQTMGTRVLRGRELTAEDSIGAPHVLVVSESMARMLWPQTEALGQCVRMREATAPCRTVVGIAEDMVQRNLADGPRLHYYVPIDQYPRTFGNGMLIKLRSDPVSSAERVRSALQQVMPAGGYLSARPLSAIVRDQQSSWVMGAAILVSFGLLALVVAGVGLYGVVGYDITQRSHEWAIRVALGADRKTIVGAVVGHSLRVVAIGVVPGLIVSVAAARWIGPLLYRTSPIDPAAYGVVASVMAVVAFVASLLPALRAAAADPNQALRGE